VFSTITGWPITLDRLSATTRAITSVGPPAAKGTINVNDRSGYAATAKVLTVTNTKAQKYCAVFCFTRLNIKFLFLSGSLKQKGLNDAALFYQHNDA
jgi:hypothetical protein